MPAATPLIGFVGTIGRAHLGDLLLRADVPDVAFVSGTPRMLAAQLRAGAIACAVLPGDVPDALAALPLVRERLVAVVRADDPLAKEPRIKPADLAGRVLAVAAGDCAAELRRLARVSLVGGRMRDAPLADVLALAQRDEAAGLMCSGQADDLPSPLVMRPLAGAGTHVPLHLAWCHGNAAARRLAVRLHAAGDEAATKE